MQINKRKVYILYIIVHSILRPISWVKLNHSEEFRCSPNQTERNTPPSRTWATCCKRTFRGSSYVLPSMESAFMKRGKGTNFQGKTKKEKFQILRIRNNTDRVTFQDLKIARVQLTWIHSSDFLSEISDSGFVLVARTSGDIFCLCDIRGHVCF